MAVIVQDDDMIFSSYYFLYNYGASGALYGLYAFVDTYICASQLFELAQNARLSLFQLRVFSRSRQLYIHR